ncbi:MAG: hypothetical protein EOO02_13365, partial [Chitinophagaceae bacterium]
MKRFFTLAALLITIVSFAAPVPRGGRIIISNSDNSLISVRLNGRMYNVNRQTIFLENLAGGKHRLEVYKTEKRPFSSSKTVLIFSQAVYVDPSYILDVFIDRFGAVNLKKNMTVRSTGNGYGNGYGDRYGERNDDRYDDRTVIRYDARNGGAMNPQYENDRNNDRNKDNNDRNNDRNSDRNSDRNNDRNNDKNGDQYNDRNS